MRSIRIAIAALSCAFAAHADFSYTVTRKGGPGGENATTHSFKGQKMKTASAAVTSIFDFDAQTVTTFNHKTKTYSTARFSDFGQAARDAKLDVKMDVRQTGQHKNVNGFNAAEVVMTMSIDSPQTAANPPAATSFRFWSNIMADTPETSSITAHHTHSEIIAECSAIPPPRMSKVEADLRL